MSLFVLSNINFSKLMFFKPLGHCPGTWSMLTKWRENHARTVKESYGEPCGYWANSIPELLKNRDRIVHRIVKWDQKCQIFLY